MNDKEKLNEFNEFMRFSINLNWIYRYDGGREDPKYREIAKEYLIANNIFTNIEGYCAKWNYNFGNLNGDWEKRKKIVTFLSETFPSLYINAFEDIVCDLSENIDIPKDSEFYFNYFFAYRLSNTPITEIDAFLEYQLKINFNNECETFFRYLTVLPREYSRKISNAAITTIEEWINAKKIIIQQSVLLEKDNGAEIDLSDTKANGKIIYLKELGILDFLREKSPFNISTNALATVISAITGERLTTLQPYLNPMFNQIAEQKNNPYNNKKNVEKVKKQLIEAGFQL